jgi:hypothetical protein
MTLFILFVTFAPFLLFGGLIVVLAVIADCRIADRIYDPETAHENSVRAFIERHERRLRR